MIENEQRKGLENPLAVPLSGLSSLWRDDAVRISVIVFLVLRIATAILALVLVSDTTLERPPMLFWDPILHTGNASGAVYYESIPGNSLLDRISAPWRVYDT